MNVRPFLDALRKAGFVGFTKSYSHQEDGKRVLVEYECQLGLREMDVQFWEDGCHRASHMLLGCSDTTPTVFYTPEECVAAVTRELTRLDHPRWDRLDSEYIQGKWREMNEAGEFGPTLERNKQ